MERAFLLLVYFLSYSTIAAAFGVCVLARLKKGPNWLSVYGTGLFAALAFLLVRNLGLLVKYADWFRTIETGTFFFILLNASSGLFLGSFMYLLLGFSFPGHSGITRTLGAVTGLLPVAGIAIVLLLVPNENQIASRLWYDNLVMYYGYYCNAGIGFVLLFRYRSMPAGIIRRLSGAFAASEMLFIVMGFVQWLGFRNEEYSLYPLSVSNISLAVTGAFSMVILGREYLPGFGGKPAMRSPGQTASPGSGGTDGLSVKELQMLRYIHAGLTNQEIAQLMGLNLPAVKSSIHRLFTRYGAQSRAGLLRATGLGQKSSGPKVPEEASLPGS